MTPEPLKHRDAETEGMGKKRQNSLSWSDTLCQCSEEQSLTRVVRGRFIRLHEEDCTVWFFTYLFSLSLIKYSRLNVSHSAAFVRSQCCFYWNENPGWMIMRETSRVPYHTVYCFLHLKILSALEIMSVFTISCSLLGSWNTKWGHMAWSSFFTTF